MDIFHLYRTVIIITPKFEEIEMENLFDSIHLPAKILKPTLVRFSSDLSKSTLQISTNTARSSIRSPYNLVIVAPQTSVILLSNIVLKF